VDRIGAAAEHVDYVADVAIDRIRFAGGSARENQFFETELEDFFRVGSGLERGIAVAASLT
jgi:hypothetical protein